MGRRPKPAEKKDQESVTFIVDLGHGVTLETFNHLLACTNAQRIARETGENAEVKVIFERTGNGYALVYTPTGEVTRQSLRRRQA